MDIHGTRRSPALTATECTGPAVSTCGAAGTARFHTCTVWSSPPLTTVWPSALTATAPARRGVPGYVRD